MTVAANASKVQYNCDGITKAFAFTFNCAATSEVQVILTDANGVETVLTETLHYAVSATGKNYTAGGTVTTVSTYATGNTITILRNMAITQESDFYEGQPTLYGTFEEGLDHLARIIQQQKEQLSRAPLLAKSTALPTIALPNPEASKLLGWNSTATALQNASIVIGISTLSGTVVWNPGDLADGGQETSADITVTGAALGDYVMVSAPYDLAGMTATAYVKAANTVNISIVNETGGNINLASGTWKVLIIK
jgi:hypothetical protein